MSFIVRPTTRCEMTTQSKTIAVGAASVVLYDVLASVCARALGFAYGWAVIGSWLIYSAIGFLVAKADRTTSGFRVGMALGLVDSTVGWAVSWVAGPGRVPDATVGAIIVTIVLVVLTAGAFGALGAVVARQRVSTAV